MRRRTWLGVLIAAAAAGGAGVFHGGLYDISATDQHLRPTYRLLETAMRRSVKRRAADIVVPPLEDPVLQARGLAHYRANCVQCHGAPGVSPEPFALGMTPPPANLAHTAREWTPSELYWVIKRGIKMSGMPAWEFRMADADLWAVVAFLTKMPALSPRAYRALQPRDVARRAETATPPDPRRGKQAIAQYACMTCHAIPGVVGGDAPVGPPLEGFGSRAMVAGMLPNTEENLRRWLLAPQLIHPDSAMPDLGLTEQDARDIAAYLKSLP